MRLLICVALLTLRWDAGAETYIAGQFGAGFPEPLIDVNVGGPGGERRTSLDFDIGLLYEAKLGHHFEATEWKWVGVEMEVFRTTINMPQQPRRTVQMGHPGVTPVYDVVPRPRWDWSFAAFNFTFRYPFDA